jgi:hypothetical protein
VAVKDVAAALAAEAGDEFGQLVAGQVDGVLPTGVVTDWSPLVSADYLEVGQMQVDGVRHIRDQLPQLGGLPQRLHLDLLENGSTGRDTARATRADAVWSCDRQEG